MGLTPNQRFLLNWLSQEDRSALGECRGSDLDRLVDLRLAEINGHPPYTGYEGVRLTEAGRQALSTGESGE